MPELSFTPEAAEKHRFARDNDTVRFEAQQQVLGQIQRGTAFARAIRGSKINANISTVRIHGRDEEDIILWDTTDTGDVVVIYIGARV